jgi:Family of unknown function (DUF6338)
MELEKIKSIEQVYIILVFVAPGLITVYFRSLFIVGRRPKTLEYVAEYIIISTIYLALSLPVLEKIAAVPEPTWARAIFGILFLGALPALFGLLLGAGSQKGWWRVLFNKMKLFPVSPYPTGWDWVFGQLSRPTYVLVTLDDGSRVAGLFGYDSLAASKPEERDIYIDEVYDFDDSRQWTARSPKQGILIPFKSIKYIEFWD